MTRTNHPFREKYNVQVDYSFSSVTERHSTQSQKKNQNMHLNGNIMQWIGQNKLLRTVKSYIYKYTHVNTGNNIYEILFIHIYLILYIYIYAYNFKF